VLRKANTSFASCTTDLGKQETQTFSHLDCLVLLSELLLLLADCLAVFSDPLVLGNLQPQTTPYMRPREIAFSAPGGEAHDKCAIVSKQLVCTCEH
jgi:hypothetical protein